MEGGLTPKEKKVKHASEAAGIAHQALSIPKRGTTYYHRTLNDLSKRISGPNSFLSGAGGNGGRGSLTNAKKHTGKTEHRNDCDR